MVVVFGTGQRRLAVEGATGYRVEISDALGDLVGEPVEVSGTELPLPGLTLGMRELYDLEVQPLGVVGARPYKLRLKVLDQEQCDHVGPECRAAMDRADLSADEQRLRLIDIYGAVNGNPEKGELWLSMLPLAEALQQDCDWMMQLRLADVYFYLGRFDEAVQLAIAVKEASGETLEGAIAQEILGKTAIARGNMAQGRQLLSEAKASYEHLGATELVKKVNAALR